MTSRRLHLTGLLAACVAAAALPATASAAAPTDPQAASQQPLQLMHVGQALDLIARPLADVPVMVADTGLEWSNVDINPRLWRTPVDSQVADPDNDRVRTVPAGSIGWDFIGGANVGRSTRPDIDPHDPDGGSGHGTAVAGLLGATWNNGIGSAGVAPNARFLAARTCWDGDECYEHIQGAAIDWAASLGVRVVSFSWLSGPLDADSPLRKAIVDHPEVLFVTIPSGNGGAYDADGDNPMPCNLDVGNVICVSTSAPDDGLDCGAYGPRSVDVAVPTQNNYTTRNGSTLGGPVSQGPTGCATSWAAPTAAGLATILFGIDSAARPADVRSAIVDSARRAPAWQGKSVSGGVADAAAAVALFQQRRGITPAPQPPVVQPPTGSLRRGPVIRPGNQDLVRPKVLDFRSIAGGRTIRFRLSEKARVRITFYRGLAGRKPRGGRCTPGKKIGRYCIVWTKQGVLAPSAGFVKRAFNLKSTLMSDPRRRLQPGRIRAQLVAIDAAGNRTARSFDIAFLLPR
ncbi:S8 family serine peptidase [Conexibacter sp. JD483]|uniref:S8 family serine peptidase n=1 Tax=unclassified Conexibacter TaxID=2627773 RepID=UPI0027263648|nr:MULTISPECIES: S8 family serine peptidase [unclassified Conexibacter]MDO8188776.1 S8 family serine peptidase [Conexibacter sp. CPCC 205706]MDO8201713.1 S8 family serine peptidase [Conexibacter sp. CPCC 205762]MDR9371374.1 S8 family serine peptidase [Conexibacter sp. JD483]